MAFQSLYVHLPFCLRRCNYCDFLSHTYADVMPLAAAYPEAVKQELRMYRNYAEPLRSVYFGGGTPTVLPAQVPVDLLAFIKETFALWPNAEITVECNPATADYDYFCSLRQTGFNRLSIGAQSFIDEELRAMGRLHSAADTVACVEMARRAGFDNVSLDVIYALPGQTMEQARYNLLAALELLPQHISLYALQLDNNSVWGQQAAAGALMPIDEDLEADMLQMAWALLKERGFKQYEIANFALKAERDFRSRHNRLYWQREDYLGVGLGAASCLGLRRWQNVGSLQDYVAALASLHRPSVDEEVLSRWQGLSEAMFLGLRQTAGLDIYPIIDKFGVDPLIFYQNELPPLYRAQLLEYIEDSHTLRLTERGLMVADMVALSFIK